MPDLIDKVGGLTRLPIFPLPLVLIPNELLPLHIFEDRYQRMLEDIKSKRNLFGVVLHEEGASAARMMSLGVHLRIIGRPGRIRAFDRFLQHARSKPGVWFATRLEIARAFAAHVPAPAEQAAR